MPNTLPTNSVAGGAAVNTASKLPRLAPDLTWPSRVASTLTTETVNVNPAGALTTAISASGKFCFSGLVLAGLTNEVITIKLTIDGAVIWDATYSHTGSNKVLLNADSGTTSAGEFGYQVNNSLLFQIQTATDTSVDVRYRLRPIL